MFQALTNYLLQYNRVSIPNVGSFELVPQSAVVDIANQVIYPPSYHCRFSAMDAIHQHQIQYLSQQLDKDERLTGNELEDFGLALKEAILKEPFVWKGIGQLEAVNSKIIFHFYTILNEALIPVPAKNAKHEKRSHTVLIGEKEVEVDPDAAEATESKGNKTSIVTIVGWVLAAVAVGFIAYYLYKNNFSVFSVGSKIDFTPATPAPLHK